MMAKTMMKMVTMLKAMTMTMHCIGVVVCRRWHSMQAALRQGGSAIAWQATGDVAGGIENKIWKPGPRATDPLSNEVRMSMRI